MKLLFKILSTGISTSVHNGKELVSVFAVEYYIYIFIYLSRESPVADENVFDGVNVWEYITIFPIQVLLTLVHEVN